MLILAQAAPPNPLTSFIIPMVLIFAIFYFLLIRPQQKKEKERQAMIAAVSKGDNILTNGGIYGKITQVDDTSVLIQVDDGVKIRIEKSAIASVRDK
ncbi:MAG: preprotein translocase subunit YajC [Bacteroidota bacterium]